MYKSAEQYLGPSHKKNMLMEPYNGVESPAVYNPQPHTLLYDNGSVEQRHRTDPTPVYHPKPEPIHRKPVHHHHHHDKKTHIKWETKEYTAMTDPRVWGRPFWFSLHSSAAHYPVKASNMVRDLMVGRLLALPFEIPCAKCRPHASAFIEANKGKLFDICSGRDKLFNFYVDFHNKVNQRYNKPVLSYEQARKIWMGGIKVSTMSYE
jgi:hypothetical protein